MIEFEYEPQVCECCGSIDMEEELRPLHNLPKFVPGYFDTFEKLDTFYFTFSFPLILHHYS